MAKENEPARLLLPYLQRADELQKHEPLVAYYCRLYAMDRGLKIPQNERTKYTNSLLISIMNQLEKDKKSLTLGPDDNLHLEGFASSVFEKADKQDRAGRADLNTAKTFYAASIFFEILNQFGEVQPDLEQKQKYAVWKAADIRKALKEGRKPEPGPPGGDKDPSILSSTPSNEYDLELRRIDSGTNPAPEPDPSPQFYDEVSPQHSTSIPSQHSTSIPSQHSTSIPPQHSTSIPPQHSTNVPASPHVPASPSYPTAGYFTHDFHPPTSNISENSNYFSHDFHPPPKTNLSENSTYSQPFNHEIHPQEPQLHSAQNYTSHEIPPYSYPNFQSFPSFTDSSIPPAPSHYPSYSQDSNSSYPTQSVPSKSDYSQTTLYHSGSINGTVSDVVPPAPAYKYDSNYQPTPEKVAEAHKAARFAVGALAFDDVSVAVDYLKKSLELLTNPSAGQ